MGSPFKGLGILELLAITGDADPRIPATATAPSPRLVAAPDRSVGRSLGSSPLAYPCRQAPRAAFWGERQHFGGLGRVMHVSGVFLPLVTVQALLAMPETTNGTAGLVFLMLLHTAGGSE